MLVQFQKRNCSWSTAELRTVIRYALRVAYTALPLSDEWTALGLTPEISVTFVGPDAMREINAETRGIDRVTDVLSFPFLDMKEGEFLPKAESPADLRDGQLELSFAYEEETEEAMDPRLAHLGLVGADFDPETGNLFLGDILICPDRAEEQALEYGHSLQREVAFLSVHGLLHLLGYDHECEEDRVLMEELQDELLEQLGLTREMSTPQAMAWIRENWKRMDAVERQLSEENLWLPETEAAFEPTEEEAAAYSEEEEEDWDDEEEEEEEDDAASLHFAEGDDEPHASCERNGEHLHSGFVALLGRPNAGKSTLLNQLSGQRLAIVSRKAQTTRHNIRAIHNDDTCQIIFTDTPGLHKPDTRLGEYMQDSAKRALRDADVLLLLVDATRGRLTPVEQSALEAAHARRLPVIVILNKTDILEKEALLPLIRLYSHQVGVRHVLPISARTGEGVNELIPLLRELLPVGPRYYPEDSFTDQSERQIVAEMIREQLLTYTHEEVPHGTAVQIDSFEECGGDEEGDDYDRSLVRIHASILCDKDSHKGIIIGKGGQSLKRIGSSARRQIEQMLGCKVYLELHVKVRPDWRNRRGILNDLGYRDRD